YEFLRNLEHRLQYLDDAQTHTLPANGDDRLRVARMMGETSAGALEEALERHRQRVAARFDAIFHEPQPEAGADCSGPRVATLSEHDTPETVTVCLAALGFDDAESAAQRLLL